MGLDFGEEGQPRAPSIFPHSEETDTGQGRERIGQATIIVSLDGSGDTDDIQEAIDLLPPTGGAIYIKEGTYKITETINITKDNVQITGDGRAARILNLENVRTFLINDKDNFLISGIKLEGSITSGTLNTAIVAVNSNQSIIQDCYILNCGGSGMAIASCRQMHILNNEVNACNGDGMAFQTMESLILTGNRIRDNDNHGMDFLNISDSSIIGNNFLFNGTNGEGFNGIHLDNGDRVTIMGNVIESSRNYGIELTAFSSECLISGNIFENNVTGAVLDNSANTLPNGATGTNNLALDDLNILS